MENEYADLINKLNDIKIKLILINAKDNNEIRSNTRNELITQIDIFTSSISNSSIDTIKSIIFNYEKSNM